jgi:hypothetical protein
LQRFARFVERWDQRIVDLLRTFVAVGAFFVVFRRRQMRESETRWATSIGFAIGVVTFASYMLSLRELEIYGFLKAMSMGTFFGLGVWIAYLTLEPYVRRFWPTLLIAWTRLLSGRFRDPMVGKHVLVGILFGLVIAAVRLVEFNLPAWLGDPLWPAWYGITLALGSNLILADMAGDATLAVFDGFIRVLILVLLRVLLGRPWLAGLVFVPIAALFVDANFLRPWGWITAVLGALLFLWLLLRFGMLAAVVCISIDQIVRYQPLYPDLSTWFAKGTIIPVLFLLALVGYALYAATHGRPGIPATR